MLLRALFQQLMLLRILQHDLGSLQHVGENVRKASRSALGMERRCTCDDDADDDYY
jgi:hypothetical protein